MFCFGNESRLADARLAGCYHYLAVARLQSREVPAQQVQVERPPDEGWAHRWSQCERHAHGRGLSGAGKQVAGSAHLYGPPSPKAVCGNHTGETAHRGPAGIDVPGGPHRYLLTEAKANDSVPKLYESAGQKFWTHGCVMRMVVVYVSGT